MEKLIYELIDDISFYRDISNDFNALDISSFNDVISELNDIETNAIELMKSELKFREGNTKVDVSVIGDFSSGKSSFINSILGEEICPVKVNPTTSSITKFIYSDRKKILLMGSDKEITQNQYEELSQHNSKKNNQSFEIEYHYPFENLRDISIYDTPGFNNVENKNDEIITINRAKASDIILFILDINKGEVSSDILDKIRRIKEFNSNQKWYLIINKADSKPGDRAVKILENCKTRYKDLFYNFFLYSAKEIMNSSLNKELQNEIEGIISNKINAGISSKKDFDINIIGKKKGRTGSKYNLTINNQQIEVSLNKVKYLEVKEKLLSLLNEVSEDKSFYVNKKHKISFDIYRKRRFSVIEKIEKNLELNKRNKLSNKSYINIDDLIKQLSCSFLKINDYMEKLIDQSLFVKRYDWGFFDSVKYGSDDSRVVEFKKEEFINLFNNYFKQVKRPLDIIVNEIKQKYFIDIENHYISICKSLPQNMYSVYKASYDSFCFKDDEGYKNNERVNKAKPKIIEDLKSEVISLVEELLEPLKICKLDSDMDSKIQSTIVDEIWKKNNLFKETQHTVQFDFRPSKEYNSVYLTGSFSNWKKKKELQMQLVDLVYQVTLKLSKGRFEYKFLADKELIADKQSIEIGYQNSSVIYV